MTPIVKKLPGVKLCRPLVSGFILQRVHEFSVYFNQHDLSLLSENLFSYNTTYIDEFLLISLTSNKNLQNALQLED